MRGFVITIVLSVALFLLPDSVISQNHKKYHRFEVIIPNTETVHLRREYVKKLNVLLDSKHSGYHKVKGKFIFFTRKYYSIPDVKALLSSANIDINGPVVYIAPITRVNTNNNTSNQ